MRYLSEEIIRRLLKRQPTDEDYVRVNEVLALMPNEMRESPAAVYQVVMQVASLQKHDELLTKATWEAQQKVHEDLPHRIDDAALKALNKIRHTLPIDASDSFRRTSKVAIILVVVCALVFGATGFVVGARHERNFSASLHAASEIEFGRCIDAAAGRFLTTNRRGSRKAPVSNDSLRIALTSCAAEYADRKATGS